MSSFSFPAASISKLIRRAVAPILLSSVVGLSVLLLGCGGADDKGGSSGSSGPDKAAAGSCSGGKLASMKRGDSTQRFANGPERVTDPSKSYKVHMKTVKGEITLDLDAANAPNTVNSFVFLSCSGFFDGLTFHRYEPGFVIQGGDPLGSGRGGPGYNFDNEISPKLRHNAAGVISMANSGPNTNGSQFFILLAPAPSLDDKYNAFGKVSGGMDVVNQIREGDKITSVSVEEK